MRPLSEVLNNGELEYCASTLFLAPIVCSKIPPLGKLSYMAFSLTLSVRYNTLEY